MLKNRKDSGVEEAKKLIKPRHSKMASMESIPDALSNQAPQAEISESK